MRQWILYGVWVAVGVAVILGLWMVARAVAPPPPETIVIATGGPAGAYAVMAERYQAVMARRGVTLEIRNTAGSVENLQLLRDNEVDVAFLQGGTAPEDPGDLIGLCSVFLEPMWVFVPETAEFEDLRGLRGQRVAVGVEGSGTRRLAMTILTETGVTRQTATLLDERADASALRSGTLDAAFVVGALQSGTVQQMLAAPGVRALSLRRQAAYARRHSYLEPIDIPEGLIDPAQNLPPEPIHGIGAAAELVAHQSLHPGIITVLLRAVQEVHAQGDLLSAPGTFPSPDVVELPISEDARHFFEEGPSFVYRVLPLWLAGWINRLVILAIPLITLFIPISRILPPVYHWQMRSRIYRWYEVLHEVESALQAGEIDASEAYGRLSKLEKELLTEVDVPLAYMEEFYALRTHIELIQYKAQRKMG